MNLKNLLKSYKTANHLNERERERKLFPDRKSTNTEKRKGEGEGKKKKISYKTKKFTFYKTDRKIRYF